MENIDFSILVHAQERFSYTRHSEIGNIEKYLSSGNSLHLAVPGYGRTLFKTKREYLSDNEGYFNPENLTAFLDEENVNPDSANHFNVTLVGGEFSRCLGRAFRIFTQWQSKTNFLNRTTLTLPSDGVFDYDARLKRPITLKDVLNDDSYLLTFGLRYFNGFFGRVTLDEEYIRFEYLKRPWGIFLSSGKTILKRDPDLYALE